MKSQLNNKPRRSTGKSLRTNRAKIKTGGHLFVRSLQSKEVDYVFGTTGAGMPDIQDAMVIVKPPKWIQGLHEFVSVNAASGYALSSGKAGVALIDRIVGTQNSIGALFCAFHSSSPLIVFASSNIPGVPIETRAPELHYSSYQNLIVAPWVKWSSDVNSLVTLQDDMDKAFYLALSEQRGPVYVTLRQDLMARRLRSSEGKVSKKTYFPISSPRVPDDQTVDKLFRKLLGSHAPEIMVSHAGRRPEAVPSLVKFAHAFGIPVRERRFFMNYPTTDPLHLGFVHRYNAPEVRHNSDLVVALELGLLPHQNFGQGVDVVDLNSDPLHRQDVYAGGDYGSSLFPATIRASCDVGPTLDKITKVANSGVTKADERSVAERVEVIAGEHAKKFEDWREKAEASYQSEKVNDWSIGYVMNKHLSKLGEQNITWVNGAATSLEVLLETVEATRPGSYFGNPSGHLGVAVGMAYGVSLAKRRYENVRDAGGYKIGSISDSSHIVICTIGDGDAIFGNIDSALWTCKHYGIGVLYVILNNACWGAEWSPIAESSQHWAEGAKDFEFLDLDLPRIDYARIATGFQVKSFHAETSKQMNTAFRLAIETVRKGEPALLDLIMEKYTGPEASVVP